MLRNLVRHSHRALPGARRTALALCVLPFVWACAAGRPAPEPSSATTSDERIAELERRVARDRATLERYVSTTDASALPDPSEVREIAWRLPDYQRELAELRGAAAPAEPEQ